MMRCMSQHVCEYICRWRIIVFVCWHYGYLILLFLDEHTKMGISLTILVQMSLLEQLLSSEEHEWKEDTCCVCMDLFVSGGFTLHQMDSVALIPLFSHTRTHKARTSVCVCVCPMCGEILVHVWVRWFLFIAICQKEKGGKDGSPQ